MPVKFLNKNEIPKDKSPIYYTDVEIKIQGKLKRDVTKEIIPGIICKGIDKSDLMKNLYKRIKLKGKKQKDYVIINVVLLKQLGFGVLEN